VSVQPLPSAAEDEILGADLQAVPAPPGGRHRRKKLCIGMTVVLLLALVVFKGMAAGDEAADSSAMAAPEMLVAPAGGGRNRVATGGFCWGGCADGCCFVQRDKAATGDARVWGECNFLAGARASVTRREDPV